VKKREAVPSADQTPKFARWVIAGVGLLILLPLCFGHNAGRQPRNLLFEQIIGPQAAGRDILLKVSSTCDRCRQATREVVSRYSARRMIAVTYLEADRLNREYVEQFHIPMVVISIEGFFTLGGTLEVPQCFQIEGTNLVRLQIKNQL